MRRRSDPDLITKQRSSRRKSGAIGIYRTAALRCSAALGGGFADAKA
jgi:hypothetical protein